MTSTALDALAAASHLPDYRRKVTGVLARPHRRTRRGEFQVIVRARRAVVRRQPLSRVWWRASGRQEEGGRAPITLRDRYEICSKKGT
jgi:hypothetical protein